MKRPSWTSWHKKTLEFDASIIGGELPVNGDVGIVAAIRPSGDFVDQRRHVRDAVLATLTCQGRQFTFCDIEPTARLKFVCVLDCDYREAVSVL